MPKFRKKPVVIEAKHLENHTDQSNIIHWAHEKMHPAQNSIMIAHPNGLTIRTLEGEMTAYFGDWIIKGVKGEFYPCKSDIFEQTYEAVK